MTFDLKRISQRDAVVKSSPVTNEASYVYGTHLRARRYVKVTEIVQLSAIDVQLIKFIILYPFALFL